MTPRKPLSSTALTIVLLIALPCVARAQSAPVFPLPTTLVIERPASEDGYNHKPTIEIGVKDQSYKFILHDAYVDDPTGKFFWDNIRRSIQNFRPNFLAQGTDADAFTKIKPGETVTVKGMYSASTRTFEVTDVTPGAGVFAPPHRD
jgi:hypothetical protein